MAEIEFKCADGQTFKVDYQLGQNVTCTECGVEFHTDYRFDGTATAAWLRNSVKRDSAGLKIGCGRLQGKSQESPTEPDATNDLPFVPDDPPPGAGEGAELVLSGAEAAAHEGMEWVSPHIRNEGTLDEIPVAGYWREAG